MSNNNLSEKQIEVMNMLRSVSGGEVSSDMIDEVISMMGSGKISETQKKEMSDLDIKLKLMETPDSEWRKKASLSALLISRGLDY